MQYELSKEVERVAAGVIKQHLPELKSKSIVYVTQELKDDKTYIIVSQENGIVYKRIRNHPDRQCVTAVSDNEVYPPYTIDYADIREIWKYHAHIVFSDAKQQQTDWLQESVKDMQKKIAELQQKL